MRKSMFAFLGSAALVLCSGVDGLSQETQRAQERARGAQTESADAQRGARTQQRSMAGAAYRVSDLMNMEVVNQTGEDVGDVKDIVLDAQTGRVRYLAMSVGGVLGIGDKLFAVPWQAFRIQQREDETQLVINAEPETFEGAPGFDEESWPNFADEQWATTNDRFYSDQGVVRTRTDRRDTRQEGGSQNPNRAQDAVEP